MKNENSSSSHPEIWYKNRASYSAHYKDSSFEFVGELGREKTLSEHLGLAAYGAGMLGAKYKALWLIAVPREIASGKVKSPEQCCRLLLVVGF